MGGGVGDWISTAAGDVWGGIQDIGKWGYNNPGQWLPAGIGGLTSMWSNHSQNDAISKAQKQQAMMNSINAQQNQAIWRQNAFPNQAAINAAREAGMASLGQARLGAQNNLWNTAAARGWGPGSGLGTRENAAINQQYIRGLGDFQNKLTQFANTPQFGFPASGYPQPMTAVPKTSAGGALANNLGTSLGYMQMMQWLRGNRGGQNPVNPTDAYRRSPFGGFGQGYFEYPYDVGNVWGGGGYYNDSSYIPNPFD